MTLEINGKDYLNLMTALDTRLQRIEKMRELYQNDPSDTLQRHYLDEQEWCEAMKLRIQKAMFPSLYPETVNA